ncbi:MAG: PorV/PorQ family protein [candidate division Zixibacteria bacterium]|nr:PorV/PorQ family protein [candidate division Zixibacteria bacterium]
MKPRKAIVLTTALLLVFAFASQSYADISSAAVLFLRIAAGSRASGMGEAFVAVADDATTTHWNPAGLGAYPLADSWIQGVIPYQYRPISGMAVTSKGGGGNYLNYDIWALTSQGLARYDNKKWYLSEVFDTKTDDEVSKIVASYFSVKDDAKLTRMVRQVAEANSKMTYNELVELKDKVLAGIPQDYKYYESLTKHFDSLLLAYDLCKINWEKVKEINDLYRSGMKDSVLENDESEKVNFAVEKSRSRFVPEELYVPYSVMFDGEFSAVTSNGKSLLIGTDRGLVVYDGKYWQNLNTENGLPSNNILSLYPVGKRILVGTDNGLAVFNGLNIDTTLSTSAPKGRVTAIGADGMDNVYVVLDNDLFHFDGTNWANNFAYTVALEDTPEKLAGQFAVYGTAKEREKFLNKFDKLKLMNEQLQNQAKEAPARPVVTDSAETVPEAKETTETDRSLVSASRIRVPYLGELKGSINSIFVGVDKKVWLGTEYGVMVFDGEKWQMPGYRTYTVEEATTVGQLVTLRGFDNPEDSTVYSEQLKALNDLTGEALIPGTTVKVYSNPAAFPVNNITQYNNKVMFATSGGLLEYDEEGRWSRSGALDLGSTNAIDLQRSSDEIWVATDDRVVVRARGRSEFTFMHVKWLKELADDMYYEFLSFVKSQGDWGTLGFNVTYITYGSFIYTGETGPTALGEFTAYDLAITVAYGTSLSNRLKGGLSFKLIHSHLSKVGAGEEEGDGIAWGFAVDAGLLYHMTPRLNWGLAVTNFGPKMIYADAAQADHLPRNLAFGFSYKLIQTDYNRLLITGELNKMLVGLDDGLSEEFKEMIFAGGAEFTYANLISGRAGYYFDDEGQLKYLTLGLGINLFDRLKFDFAYIPNNDDIALANTLRMSFSLLP